MSQLMIMKAILRTKEIFKQSNSVIILQELADDFRKNIISFLN